MDVHVARPRLLAPVLLAVLIAAVLSPPLGAQSLDESLREARAERAAVQERLNRAAEDLAALQARVAELGDRRDQLHSEMTAQERVAAEADAQLSSRIRSLYKRGAIDPVLLALAGEDAAEVAERVEMVSRLTFGDRVTAETAQAARAVAAESAERLEVTQEDLAAAQAEQRAVLEDLETALSQATELEQDLEAEHRRRERQRQLEEQRRRAEQARQREAEQRAQEAQSTAPAPTTAGMACPVAAPRSFTDTWGAPRSGGRQHRGTDILASHGQDVLAIVGGVWDVRSYGRNAGKWAILRGNDGNQYWYMHLASHLVGDGAQVGAGQVVATNGDTGNARGGPPHVHFELHPGGGSAVNPYPTLKRICG